MYIHIFSDDWIKWNLDSATEFKHGQFTCVYMYMYTKSICTCAYTYTYQSLSPAYIEYMYVHV